MSLVLNEEQSYLKDTARDFAKNKTPVSHFRGVRDSENPECFDREIWKEMANLGWSGTLIPEEYGGSDFGVAGIGVIFEELGRTLTPSPMFSTAVVCASLIKEAGNEDQKKEYLTKIASGDITLAFALEESSRHSPTNLETIAKKEGDSYIINGQKTFVLDGGFADFLLIAADTGKGTSLFISSKDTKGIDIKVTPLVDSRNAANITFKDLKLPSSNLIGEENGSDQIIEEVLDISRSVISAEMFGGIQEAFDVTLNYLKERDQFGAKIGSFQALQHRAAIMFSEIELCKSCVLESLTSFDEGSNDIPRLASLAKAKIGEVFHLVSNEAVQMHGGIGVTDEYDIGFYLKRARVAEQIFGNVQFHKDRYAELTGY